MDCKAALIEHLLGLRGSLLAVSFFVGKRLCLILHLEHDRRARNMCYMKEIGENWDFSECPVLRPLQMEVVLLGPNTSSSFLRLGCNLTFFQR